jgi:NAD(P)-dependent dehydrogenase (short-subunit alcohol dehydrogenase family)
MPFPTPEEWMNRSTLTRRRDTYPFIDPFRFQNTLTRRIVLITNANRGVGRASALDFANAGATIVCTARTGEQLLPLLKELRSKYSRQAYAIPADLSDPTVPVRLVQHIQQNIGPIDILLNITGGKGPHSFLHTENFQEDWWQALELNLRAPIALIHAVLPSMIARGTGTIISTTFKSGITSVPFTTADSTSQCAIIRFHHGLDDEVRPKGVYSYVVHPGLVASHMHDPQVKIDNRHFTLEPRLQSEMLEPVRTIEPNDWCSARLASGTFLALSADPRATVLSGLYLDAERDLGELIEEAEKGDESKIRKDGLYVVKVEELKVDSTIPGISEWSSYTGMNGMIGMTGMTREGLD